MHCRAWNALRTDIKRGLWSGCHRDIEKPKPTGLGNEVSLGILVWLCEELMRRYSTRPLSTSWKTVAKKETAWSSFYATPCRPSNVSTQRLRQQHRGKITPAVITALPWYQSSDGRGNGIRIKRVDFSDPQGGKGACDRKAATVKAHVRRYVNKGYNVVTAQEFHDTMLSHRGINSVRVALVTTSSDQNQQVIASDYSEL